MNKSFTAEIAEFEYFLMKVSFLCVLRAYAVPPAVFCHYKQGEPHESSRTPNQINARRRCMYLVTSGSVTLRGRDNPMSITSRIVPGRGAMTAT